MNYMRGGEMVLPTACVLTTGKFESIHLGHRRLIDETQRLAKIHDIPSAVVTFDPHPRKVLGDPEYKSLFTSAERAHLLQKVDVDYLLEYPFDTAFASLSPSGFCNLLFQSLNGRFLVVGEGYRFGQARRGTVEILKLEGRAYGAEVTVLPHLAEAGTKISTSDIRALIGAGSLKEAASLLGFSFFIMGEVRHGHEMGRTLGFPTVNIRPGIDKFLPPDGVYVTRTHYGGHCYRSVTNVGVRPTVNHSTDSQVDGDRTVESFLLDFTGDLYGAELRTEFLHYLRPEIRFGHVEQLRGQIKKDIQSAEQYNIND